MDNQQQLNMQQEVFLYDYTVDTFNDNIYLYGYIDYENTHKKVVIGLKKFDIFLHLTINYDLFENFHQMIQILQKIKGNKSFKHSEDIYELVSNWDNLSNDVHYGKTFKGFFDNLDNPSHLTIKFKKFENYQYFKSQIYQFNEDFRSYIKDPKFGEGNKNNSIFRYLKQLALNKQIDIQKYPFRMSEDDNPQKYVYKLQRHQKFVLSDWNNITFNTLKFDNKHSRYFGFADVSNIKEIKDSPLVNPLSILSWDIEVSTLSGKFDQDAKNKDNLIICIGGSFGKFVNDESQIQHFCICYIPCKVKQINVNIIQVANELEMIMEFGNLIKQYDPTFITGFNDSTYDIPFLKDKLEMYDSVKNQLDEKYQKGVIKYFIDTYFKCNYYLQKEQIYISPSVKNLFSNTNIKIAANTYKGGFSFNIPSIICVDTRVYLMKTQKIEKKSLNEYLKANNLPLKLEVSFKDMNESFRNILSNIQQYGELEHKILTQEQITNDNQQQINDLFVMNKIMEYCAYDADACRLLWNKRLIIQQAFQMSNLSYTPIRCVFDNADGIKVRNMVASFAYDFGYSVPMDSRTSSDIRWRDTDLLDKFEKYPGAYVPEPKKGINITPVAALDFASLYPSIIMAHNLSPENIFEPQQCDKFKETCDISHTIVSLNNENGFKFKDEQQNTIIVKQQIQSSQVVINFQKDTMQQQLCGYVVCRTERVGVYPTILQYLFNLRKQVRQKITELEQQEETKEQQFQISLLNAKQLAIKVFMNTFYGETGNQNSPLFDVIISGGTTSFGQKYIKEVHSMIKQKDCEIVYGDTDSVYFRPRLSLYSGQLSIDSILRQAFDIVTTIRDEVNQCIGNKTFNYLKMEFEELLCPSLFTGKKKYCGVIYKLNHQGIFGGVKQFIDINQKDSVLLKGIDFIKSQYPPLIKKHGYQVIQHIMNHFNQQFDVLLANGQDLNSMFTDQFRFTNLNQQIPKIVLETFQELYNMLNNMQVSEYDQLSSKKKIRETESKSGEMQQFYQRMQTYTELQSKTTNEEKYQFICSKTPEELRTMININELKDLNIPIPEMGELLDIVYINFDNDKKLKTSQKMHLLQYAQIKKCKLDTKEYMKMFQTSAIRLIISSFYDENSTLIDEDSDEYKLIEKDAIQKAKVLFDGYFKQENQKIIKEVNYIQILQKQFMKIDACFERDIKSIKQNNAKLDFSKIKNVNDDQIKQIQQQLHSIISNYQYKQLFSVWMTQKQINLKLQSLNDTNRYQYLQQLYYLQFVDFQQVEIVIQLIVLLTLLKTKNLKKRDYQQMLQSILE